MILRRDVVGQSLGVATTDWLTDWPTVGRTHFDRCRLLAWWRVSSVRRRRRVCRVFVESSRYIWLTPLGSDGQKDGRADSRTADNNSICGAAKRRTSRRRIHSFISFAANQQLLLLLPLLCASTPPDNIAGLRCIKSDGRALRRSCVVWSTTRDGRRRRRPSTEGLRRSQLWQSARCRVVPSTPEDSLLRGLNVVYAADGDNPDAADFFQLHNYCLFTLYRCSLQVPRFRGSYELLKAGIPRDRHRHRHGHPRWLPREDRREDVGVSGDFPVQLATSRTRTTILADLSADLSDTRACTRVNVRVLYTISYRGLYWPF